jgi:hypothetical protein
MEKGSFLELRKSSGKVNIRVRDRPICFAGNSIKSNPPSEPADLGLACWFMVSRRALALSLPTFP